MACTRNAIARKHGKIIEHGFSLVSWSVADLVRVEIPKDG
jgi:hypothetical protein